MSQADPNLPVTIPEASPGALVVSAPVETALRGNRLSNLWKKGVREGAALIVWSYILLKLFVFDVDVYVVRLVAPSFEWLLNYKFIFFLVVFCLLVLTFRRSGFLGWILFVVLYPFIWIFWRIPIFWFKKGSWNLAFHVVYSTISFFKSFKYNLISSTLYVLCFVLCLAASSRYLLYPSLAIILGLLCVEFARRIKRVFMPVDLFRVFRRLFARSHEVVQKQYEADIELNTLPVATMNEDQLKKWTLKLEITVITDRICLFAAKKLRDYKNSGFGIISGVFTTLVLIAGTILSFWAINFALYKIDPTQFQVVADPGLFTFFYYSFKAFLFNNISELSAVGVLSRSVAMTENAFALFTIVIFASLLVSVRTQRYTSELDETIECIEADGRWVEQFIHTVSVRLRPFSYAGSSTA
jgi:hypothetical protein